MKERGFKARDEVKSVIVIEQLQILDLGRSSPPEPATSTTSEPARLVSV